MTPTTSGHGRARLTGPAILVICLALLGVAQPAGAHAERSTTFPTAQVEVPKYRTRGGHRLVVCQPESRQLIRTQLRGDIRERNRTLLRKCRFDSIQAAVDAAASYDRIYILPGQYDEPASRAATETAACGALYTTSTHGDARKEGVAKYQVATYQYQRQCPNARNLVAIIDDPDGDGDCDKCFLQIEGTGASPEDVVITGSRGADAKYDIVHVDRAHGTYLKNFTVQFAKFNGVNVIETTGYRLEDIVSRYNENYGILTFTTFNGLYNRVVSYNNGHAGLYPGSTQDSRAADGSCGSPSIEMRRVEAFGNTYGISGTGANSLWVHHSRFHHNATGVSVDSVASAHPGMPQDCGLFEHNEIYSNNLNLYDDAHDEECSKPWEERDPYMSCPYWAAPVGTGMQIAGGNFNLVQRNHIYDNHRSGIRLFWLPSPLRYQFDPRSWRDTSNHNTVIHNVMGRTPSGSVLPNGEDFWWDEQGDGNCWSWNVGVADGDALTSDPGRLPSCEDAPTSGLGHPVKMASQAPCGAFDPRNLQNPPGCEWITPP